MILALVALLEVLSAFPNTRCPEECWEIVMDRDSVEFAVQTNRELDACVTQHCSVTLGEIRLRQVFAEEHLRQQARYDCWNAEWEVQQWDPDIEYYCWYEGWERFLKKGKRK